MLIHMIREKEMNEQEDEEFKRWEDENDQGDDDWKVLFYIPLRLSSSFFICPQQQTCATQTLKHGPDKPFLQI